MPKSKIFSLEEAVDRFIKNSHSIVLGTSLETLIPFAAGHEIIRQKKRDPELIAPISDILFDQIIGGGCVKKISAAWVGNVITRSGYNFRRAVENKKITVEDHTNLTISIALRSGAMGVPYMPSRTALGRDLFTTNYRLKKIICPFTGNKLTAVSSINPSVAIIHVQKSDKFGNAHLWRNLGITREACLAADKIILTCEEIVSSDLITKDPNRIITPGFRVNAVVHAPWGTHPSLVPGFYNKGHDFFIQYRNKSKTEKLFMEWKSQWIDNIKNSDDYIKIIGIERMKALSIKNNHFSEPVYYGY